MYVKTINWIDKNFQEAEVIVSDGCTDLLCFSCPFNKTVNEELKEPIRCFNVNNVFLAQQLAVHVCKNTSFFGYSICGKLVDRKNKIVILGDIELSLEDAYIPYDIPENSYIEFEVSRLDLY